MRGRIGSGKTYKARLMCAETGAVYLGVDEVMEAKHGTACMGREAHVKAEAAVLADFLNQAVSLHGDGKDVVIDHGFWLKSELAAATEYLASKGVPYTVVEMSADFDTRLKRVSSRTSGKCFTDEKLRQLDRYYEE